MAPKLAHGSFHRAQIDEVLTSYAGDANVQFVEIKMLSGGQNHVENTVLAAFDASGNYLFDVFMMDADVPNGGPDLRHRGGIHQPQREISGALHRHGRGGCRQRRVEQHDAVRDRRERQERLLSRR
jgi:hypothetical protein